MFRRKPARRISPALRRRRFSDQESGDFSIATRKMVGTNGRTRKDDLIAWLRDAHAIEAATTDNLERLIARAHKYPQFDTQMQSF
jgi:hypothetical protein